MHELPKRRYDLICEMLDLWEETGELDAETARELRNGIRPAPFDWQRATNFLIAAALGCILAGFAALTRARLIKEILELILGTSLYARSAACAVAAAAIFLWGRVRIARFPQRAFTNEGILFLGVVFTAASAALAGRAAGGGVAAFLPGAAALVFAAVAVCSGSVLVWVFALFSFAAWLGAETGYLSDWGAYWLGLNYPARFALFGAILAAISARMDSIPRAAAFGRSTFCVGLLFFFMSLWMMSIFGNYGSMSAWRAVGRFELIHWSVIFAAAAAFVLWLGIRRDDAMLRGYGMVFLGINLYTRFFENFWDSMNKGLFFLILGGSLWFLGSRAEKIMEFGRREDKDRRKK